MVIDQTPKLMRRTKLPIVKAKIGPRIMTMVADEKIFDLIPLKKEVKATISGIYITDVRGVRGPLGTAKTEGKVLPENEKQNRKKRQINNQTIKNGAYFPVMDDKLRFLLHAYLLHAYQ